mmetsp:Transcript_50416/g.74769  ORF Transcript_50416/g.74769 Transcript_50416/m.74769 type:complete len:882 (+) Transcript_50416:102-2747(+)
MITIPFILVSVIISTDASKWNKDDKVPASFDCAMRKAAYAYGKKLIPRRGDFLELYYALDLNSDDCHEEPSGSFFGSIISVSADDGGDKHRSSSTGAVGSALGTYPSEGKDGDVIDAISLLRGSLQSTAKPVVLNEKHPEKETEGIGIPLDAIYVAFEDGDDEHPNAGAFDSPFKSIQAAADHASSQPNDSSCKTVVLRGGTHYLEDSIRLTPLHNHIEFVAYPGESPIVSGGVKLKISSWTPHNHDGSNPSKNIWFTDVSGQVFDIPGLQIDGKRATRARYPNLPGGIEVSCGYGCMIPSEDATWTPPNLEKYGKPTFYTDNVTSHARPNGGWFEHYTIGSHGLCSVYDPPVSYWCSEHPSGGGAFAFRTPAAVSLKNNSVLPNGPYQHLDDVLFFVWHPGRWANWMFNVRDYDREKGNFTFGKGGNQGARGSNQGGDFFVENVFEELDYPNEFYYDKEQERLYLFHNGTGPPPSDSTLVVPKLRTLLNLTGTQWNPVRGINFSGISYRATRYTYMDAHAVPSAGDWSLVRNAAVFLQGTEQVEFDRCAFDRLDGNALMLSGYNRNATIQNSDFSFIGANAIASWGYTNETRTDPGRPGVILENYPHAGIDGTDGEHPRFTTITGCTAREVGLYEKQSSFYVQAKTVQSNISGNVFFNGPRAGINFNDGFGGGDVVASNLVFSTCRESGDHGPLNSWDRQPFLTSLGGDGDGDGGLTPPSSMHMMWREIHHNFFVDNYSPQENVDNDDGSAYFKTHHNVLVYGLRGMKNDFGGHDNRHFNNLYAYVYHGLNVCKQLPGHEDYFYSNKVVMTGHTVGHFACAGAGKTVVHDNEYFTSDGDIQECGMSLADWQIQGGDNGSTVHLFPTDDSIIQWAQHLLGF